MDDGFHDVAKSVRRDEWWEMCFPAFVCWYDVGEASINIIALNITRYSACFRVSCVSPS